MPRRRVSVPKADRKQIALLKTDTPRKVVFGDYATLVLSDTAVVFVEWTSFQAPEMASRSNFQRGSHWW
jgi:hypothetical protein